jgi:magnesium transporter
VRAPHDAAEILSTKSAGEVLSVLGGLNTMVVQQILRELPETVRESVHEAATEEQRQQWLANSSYPEDTVGWLMEGAVAVFRPHATAAEAIEAIRKLSKKAMITYGYVTDDENQLLGVLVMRDLMIAEPTDRLESVMLKDVFALQADTLLTDAMRETVNLHFPVYPVCDENRHLVGLLRGQNLFEARTIEISAQAGEMVGVESEERLTTPIQRSLKLRHPWLQINLATCFVAALVVALFQDTLDRIMILAAFIPVVSGQSSNTGCQALAVSLRGITLGEVGEGGEKRLVTKEALLGLLNGALVGVTAGIGMGIYAWTQEYSSPAILGLVVLLAMVASCIVSGVAGALIPLVLKRLGADPATASGIFVTTATDVVSIGVFLALASWLAP